jgi:hypothetical protein
MKTALQQLHEHLTQNINGLRVESNEEMGKAEQAKYLDRITVLKMVLTDIERFLPTEQAIIDAAYNKGANADKWVSVDSCPDVAMGVIMLDDNTGRISIGRYSRGKYYNVPLEFKFTHWLPLPTRNPKPPHP